MQDLNEDKLSFYLTTKLNNCHQMSNRTMKFSKAQFSAGEERHVKRVLDESLVDFEDDTKSGDPKLAEDIATYRRAGDLSLFQRIIELTNIGTYQRTLLAMALQSGIDFTTNENFAYIVKNPALSGNTKARHLILMAVIMQQTKG
jgi:hypothetical protein